MEYFSLYLILGMAYLYEKYEGFFSLNITDERICRSSNFLMIDPKTRHDIVYLESMRLISCKQVVCHKIRGICLRKNYRHLLTCTKIYLFHIFLSRLEK